MAATFNVVIDYGGTTNSPATTDETLTNLRFNSEESNDQDTASPVQIPSSGTTYSNAKHVSMKCTGAPSVQCSNFKLYTDGTLGWTGSTIKVGDQTCQKNSGSTAGYDPVSGAVLTTHDTITSTTSLFTYTSGSPKSLTCSESGSLIDATNELIDYIVLQEELDNTGTEGVQATETLTIQYDEI